MQWMFKYRVDLGRALKLCAAFFVLVYKKKKHATFEKLTCLYLHPNKIWNISLFLFLSPWDNKVAQMIHNVMRNRGRNMKQNVYDQETFYKGYKAIRERAHNYNNLLEQPALESLMPDVSGKVVLDIGCGSGDFAAKCVRNGAAHVIGIDISENMINDARLKYSGERLEFIQVAFEDVKIDPSSIDIVVSSLAFHYMANFRAVMEKVSHVLRDDGELLFSCEHPIVTANKGGKDWVLDEKGAIRHFAVDHYHDEGQRTLTWIVEGVVMYHRSMSTIVNTMIECGLKVEQLVEPTPTEEAVALLPTLAKEFRRPSFLIVKGRKG